MDEEIKAADPGPAAFDSEKVNWTIQDEMGLTAMPVPDKPQVLVVGHSDANSLYTRLLMEQMAERGTEVVLVNEGPTIHNFEHKLAAPMDFKIEPRQAVPNSYLFNESSFSINRRPHHNSKWTDPVKRKKKNKQQKQSRKRNRK